MVELNREAGSFYLGVENIKGCTALAASLVRGESGFLKYVIGIYSQMVIARHKNAGMGRTVRVHC